MPHGHGGNSEAVAGSDGDDGAGEAGGILFAPSPCAQAGEPSPASFLPPASAGAAISGAQEGQRGGETCESGTGPAALQPTVSDGAREGRDSSGGVMPAHIEMTGDARAPGPVGLKARQNKNESLSSATASVSGEQGRWRVGSGSARKARKQRGEEPGRGGNGGAEGERSAKVDTEWENEIAKNILSLYQTKLKADLDDKESAKQNELMVRKEPPWSTLTRMMWVKGQMIHLLTHPKYVSGASERNIRRVVFKQYPGSFAAACAADSERSTCCLSTHIILQVRISSPRFLAYFSICRF